MVEKNTTMKMGTRQNEHQLELNPKPLFGFKATLLSNHYYLQTKKSFDYFTSTLSITCFHNQAICLFKSLTVLESTEQD